MLKNIFLDLDDTILNFTAGEAKALSQTLRETGIEPTEAILDRYHIINIAHWELLEEGRLTRDEVLVQRFEQLFRELGVDHSGKAISERYEVLLSCQHDFMPGAEQLLKDLTSRYDLYLASNGAAAVQNPRLDDAGLRPYFKGIFISEEMGADKPSPAAYRTPIPISAGARYLPMPRRATSCCAAPICLTASGGTAPGISSRYCHFCWGSSQRSASTAISSTRRRCTGGR